MGLWLEGIEAVEGVRLSTSALENVSITFLFCFSQAHRHSFQSKTPLSPKFHPVEFKV
jgi:hypothetical protein